MSDTLSTGYGGFCITEEIISVLPYKGSALQKLRQRLEEHGLVINACYGKQVASLIFFRGSQLVLLSSVSAEALRRRITKQSEQGGN